jgi:hypothetical protein
MHQKGVASGGMDFFRIIIVIAKNVPEHHTGATKNFLPQALKI